MGGDDSLLRRWSEFSMPQKAIAHERSTQRSAARRARPAAVSFSSTNLSLCCPRPTPCTRPSLALLCRLGTGSGAGERAGSGSARPLQLAVCAGPRRRLVHPPTKKGARALQRGGVAPVRHDRASRPEGAQRPAFKWAAAGLAAAADERARAALRGSRARADGARARG